MLSPSRIQSFIDELLASHGCYRPVDLLLKTGRLPYPRYDAWRHGQLPVLEDGMAGNPEHIVALLRRAAACAAELNLRAEVETCPAHGANPADALRIFRKSYHDRLARTVYRRTGDSPQLNLFLDNRLPQARKRLCLALLEHDAPAAEHHLAEMAQADPGNDLQADAEQLVDALAWLQGAPGDAGRLLHLIETELMPRARNLLGEDAPDFLAPFWRHLSAKLAPARFDPAQPRLHPSWTTMQIPDWPAVIAAALAVQDHCRHPALLARLATAALAHDDRGTAIPAVFQLCWQAPEDAEKWLEHTTDPGLSHARDRFWDMDPPLETGDFPAWLIMTGFPVPALPDSADGNASVQRTSCQVLLALRDQPDELASRRWLHDNHPRLLQTWLGQRQTRGIDERTSA